MRVLILKWILYLGFVFEESLQEFDFGMDSKKSK